MAQWILAADGTLLRADQVVRVNITGDKVAETYYDYLEAWTDETSVQLTWGEPEAVTMETQKMLGIALSGNGSPVDMNELVLRAREKARSRAGGGRECDSEADDFERESLERGRFYEMDEKGYI